MKIRKRAKIGTHSSCTLVLWNDKPIEVGSRIWAIDSYLYDSLHSSRKNVKSNGSWEEYLVDDIGAVLFLSL